MRRGGAGWLARCLRGLIGQSWADREADGVDPDAARGPGEGGVAGVGPQDRVIPHFRPVGGGAVQYMDNEARCACRGEALRRFYRLSGRAAEGDEKLCLGRKGDSGLRQGGLQGGEAAGLRAVQDGGGGPRGRLGGVAGEGKEDVLF